VLAFHERVHEGYKYASRHHPTERIDATQDIATVASTIRRVVSERLRV
jgi:thymidylate kinase